MSRLCHPQGGRRLPPEDRNLALRALLRAAFFPRYDGSFYESGVKHTVEAVDAELHLALQNRPSGNVPLVLEGEEGASNRRNDKPLPGATPPL